VAAKGMVATEEPFATVVEAKVKVRLAVVAL
jgi:hypothetical protein